MLIKSDEGKDLEFGMCPEGKLGLGSRASPKNLFLDLASKITFFLFCDAKIISFKLTTSSFRSALAI